MGRGSRRSRHLWVKARESRFSGRTGNRVGHRSEARVLRILVELDTPDWVLSARAATLEEDIQKKDMIVLTDMGEIGVQVESGTASYTEFKRLTGYDMIGCVKVKGRYSDNEILSAILKELEEIRSVMGEGPELDQPPGLCS